jgi:hypothetical protein
VTSIQSSLRDVGAHTTTSACNKPNFAHDFIPFTLRASDDKQLKMEEIAALKTFFDYHSKSETSRDPSMDRGWNFQNRT